MPPPARIRRTEVLPIPSRRAISVWRNRSALRRCTSSAFSDAVGGLPWGRPSFRAWAMPARTRSRRISRSNSANTASMPVIARPDGVVRSSASARDANLYRDVSNVPTNETDPSGLVKLFGQTFVAPWDSRAGGVGATLNAYGRAAGVAAAGTAAGAGAGAVTGTATGATIGIFGGPGGVGAGALAGLGVGTVGGAISGFISAASADSASGAAKSGAISGGITGVAGPVAGKVGGAVAARVTAAGGTRIIAGAAGGAAGGAASSATGQSIAVATGQQDGYSAGQFLVDVGVGTALGARAGVSRTLAPNPASASRPTKPGSLVSEGSTSLDSHALRPGWPGPKPSGNAAAKNAQAQALVDDVLNHPNKDIWSGPHPRPEWGGTVTEVYRPDGLGVRFDANGQFVGFITRPPS